MLHGQNVVRSSERTTNESQCLYIVIDWATESATHLHRLGPDMRDTLTSLRITCCVVNFSNVCAVLCW